ncbi:hypothetical protein PGTUg99_027019 [Puccinia graminis f. sp. tritici]|uniref:Uncharacterized protein n=1 Tax=Puccinia graminis f. sp. tritici TaxID=56615 RepID=A0A5B0RMN0_PUCGR|nr:hypothetical protein PGTUg99_027019 [Puccinia graminis f. sp. tritici]
MTARSGSVSVGGQCEAAVFQLDELKEATTVSYKPSSEVHITHVVAGSLHLDADRSVRPISTGTRDGLMYWHPNKTAFLRFPCTLIAIFQDMRNTGLNPADRTDSFQMSIPR